MAQATPAQGTCKATIIEGVSVAVINGAPRARDIDLAVAMGYSSPYKIRDLIERYAGENGLGDIFTTVVKNEGQRGRPSKERWLTESQALFVAAKSDTDKAIEILQTVIRVFVSVREGQRAQPVPLIGTSPFAEFTKNDPSANRAATFELFGDRYDVRVLRAVRKLDPNPCLGMGWWVDRLDKFQGMLAAPASLATVGGVQ